MKRVWMTVLSVAVIACGGEDEGPTGPTNTTAPLVTTGGATSGGVQGSTGTDGTTATGSTAGPSTGGPAMTTTTTTGGAPTTTTGAPTTGSTMGMLDAGTGAADPCADVTMTPVPGSYAAAATVLTEMSPCAFSSCHGDVGKGGLKLFGTDLQTLVDQPSCEAPLVPLIDGSGGSAALNNSFIWLKLTSTPADGVLMGSEAEWGTPGACGQPGDEPYGQTMPLMAAPLSAERLKAISDWICQGAPAP